MNSILAELLLLRKRMAYWIILLVCGFITIIFNYLLPYISTTSAGESFGPGVEGIPVTALLPASIVNHNLASFPFFVGVLAYIIAVLLFGSEYTWGTYTNVFIQRPGRMHVFLGKVGALAVALIPFVLFVFIIGILGSLIVALFEGAAIELPPLSDFAKALPIGWFILAVWASLGVLTATVSRGTSVAIGLGILYGVLVEGVISSFGSTIAYLETISKAFMRTNGYSILTDFDVSSAGSFGPGAYEGPFVPASQAALVLGIYIVVFIAISAMLMRSRDIT